MDNLRGLLSIRRIQKVLNARIREFCEMTKGVDKRTDEGVSRWFCHVERMENDRMYWSVLLIVQWVDSERGELKKRGFYVSQARRMVHNRRVWWFKRDATVVSCHSYMKPLKGGNLPVAKPTT